MATNRRVSFTQDEKDRLHDVCRALGTTYVEFMHFAVMQAVTEVEGLGDEIRRHYHP